ncbi:hypothetical protein [Hymenobacter sp. UYP22]|uniref:hypothetical protein n=1 Tax=Hymenobacter sp. UYP22 TaxID=3156348 RepID=UPI00339A5195
MLRFSLNWCLFVLTAAVLASCCGSVACECDDRYAEAIKLQFSADAVKGFQDREIRNVFLVRVPNDTAQRPRADTVAFTRTNGQRLRDTLVINNLTPFTRSGNRNLNEYRYQVYLARTRRDSVFFRYTIDRVALETRLQGDGCCTCYQNTSKLVYTNGSTTPINLTDPSANNQLVPLVLARP